MAYYRRRRPTYRRRRRRIVRKPRTSVSRVVRNVVRNMAEKKLKTATAVESSLSTVSQGSFWDPIAISQGSTSYTRTGDTIMLTGMHIKGHVHNNSTTVPNYVRLVILQTRRAADFSAATEIFEAPSGDSDFSSITGMRAVYHPISDRNIKVLYNKVIRLGTSTTTGENTRMFSKWIKLNQKIIFNEAGTGANETAPRLHIGAWAAEAPSDESTGEAVELSFLARTWFIDM